MFFELGPMVFVWSPHCRKMFVHATRWASNMLFSQFAYVLHVSSVCFALILGNWRCSLQHRSFHVRFCFNKSWPGILLNFTSPMGHGHWCLFFPASEVYWYGSPTRHCALPLLSNHVCAWMCVVKSLERLNASCSICSRSPHPVPMLLVPDLSHHLLCLGNSTADMSKRHLCESQWACTIFKNHLDIV